MWVADDLYSNYWKYPAKVGSHGALILMCWAFILSTRLRSVEWLFGGLDKVYKTHRRLGEIAFTIIFLHPIFLAIAFSDSVQSGLRYVWFSQDPIRNTGIASLILFIVLVVFSITSKLLPYHWWKQTHHFFGALLVLVAIHAMISGGEISKYPVLQLWYGTWVLLALVSYIYIRILYRWIGPQYEYRVANVEEIGDEITEVHLRPKGRAMRFAPGQFVYVQFDTQTVSAEMHPFSISSPPEAGDLRLSIKSLGDWTGGVKELRNGAPARILGPYGRFTEMLWSQPEKPVVFIGGGIGITPFLSILRSERFKVRTAPASMIYSGTKRDALVYDKELLDVSSRIKHLSYVTHCSDDEGFIDFEYIKNHTSHAHSEAIYMICGPAPMMQSLTKLLQDNEVPAAQIITEDFSIR